MAWVIAFPSPRSMLFPFCHIGLCDTFHSPRFVWFSFPPVGLWFLFAHLGVYDSHSLSLACILLNPYHDFCDSYFHLSQCDSHPLTMDRMVLFPQPWSLWLLFPQLGPCDSCSLTLVCVIPIPVGWVPGRVCEPEKRPLLWAGLRGPPLPGAGALPEWKTTIFTTK